ncbi:transporter substrate-binding domain-containing protein [Massilia sp. B-10]|nr:transporter substrate-binding domain-containing protein [Massilia sp. B-10]
MVWEASSMSRQLIMLRKNLSPSCVVGWFKTAERQKFAKYSKALYRDGPVVALVRPDFVFQPGHTVRDILTTPGVRLLVRTGYVYGAYLDTQIRQANPAIVSSLLPNSQMSELLLASRADLMFYHRRRGGADAAPPGAEGRALAGAPLPATRCRAKTATSPAAARWPMKPSSASTPP